MANTKDYLLPDLGEGLTEAEIVSWLVEPGDAVEVDQPVAEVETAKAVVEVTCPFDGTVTTLHASVGDEVEVGKALITIDLGGDGAAPEGGEVGTAPEDAEVGEMVPEPAVEAEGEEEGEEGSSGGVLVGYGTGRARARRRRGAGRAPAAPGAPRHATSRPAPTTREGRPLAKPPVRKLAKDLGVDLAEVHGSGPDGVITREDVEAYAADGVKAPAAEPAPSPTEEPAAPSAAHEAPAPDLVERVPLRGIRKRIAERMTVSRREIPDATAWVDVDATALMDLREDLNAEQTDVRVSPLALVARAVVAGLRAFPELNARLDTETDEIVFQRFVNLGIAAQTDRGLVVPVIRDAHTRSTLSIATELNRLAAAAREGTVKPEEMTGGTFTISNYGSFGIDGGSAVINYPEAAILGVGRIAEKPWVVDGALTVRRVLQLSIAFDHRICDGGEAGGFLRFVGDCVESPTKLLAAL